MAIQRNRLRNASYPAPAAAAVVGVLVDDGIAP
jgi:hypothetical protein